MIFASVAQWPAQAVQCSPARPGQTRPRQQRRRDYRYQTLWPHTWSLGLCEGCLMTIFLCSCLLMSGPGSPDVCGHWWWHGPGGPGRPPSSAGAGVCSGSVHTGEPSWESAPVTSNNTQLSAATTDNSSRVMWQQHNSTSVKVRPDTEQNYWVAPDQDVVRHKNSSSNIPQLISRHIAHPTFLILRSLAATVARAAGIFKRLRLGLNTHYTEMLYIRTVFKAT